MSDFRPTPSQRAAIETRGSTVLVSAGAGSGKTKVLTERLMGYLTDETHPADLDSFLIITFTRAAAGELRGRIMTELQNAIAADPGNRHLRRQSALCQRAQIGTIHGFCSSLLRENCHLLGLSPDFRVMEDEREATMKLSVLERVMEECYEKQDIPDFLTLADTVGVGRDDRRLCTLVLTLHSKMQGHARPEKWAARQVELLKKDRGDAGETPWGREILDDLHRTALYWRKELDRILDEMSAEEKIAKAYAPSLSVTLSAVEELCRALEQGWDCAHERRLIPFPRLGVLRASPDPILSDRVKTRRDACKKAMERLAAALSEPSEKLLRDMTLTAPAMTALLALVLRFDERYSAEKRRNALVDYADLEHLAARLLTDEAGQPTELARRVSLRYTEIMVDEYQDVSQVQDAIFHAVSREGKNLFLVGDVKQSIYRFRLADPHIFTEKYRRFADWDKAAPGEPRRILLQENFRSRREILEGANCVFSLCMSRTLGDIDYDGDAALKYGAAYEGGAPVPELLLTARDGDEEDDGPGRLHAEAELTAREIRRLMAEGTVVNGKNGPRPLAYDDIALLLRSANAVGPVYRAALERWGIPVNAGQGGDFFRSLEISTVMSMLAVVDNPHQDIPLIAVLRAPCFGFSANELSAVRSADRDEDFYTALCRRAGEDEKCAAFLALLRELRSRAAELSACELCWEVLNRLDLPALCSAMSDGEQRRDNLMALLELAKRFEAGGYRGLHRFVLWLRRLAEKGQDGSGGSGGGVQILSVHKSKGLEFPVVFLCDTARRFNRQDAMDTVLVHPELGLGPKRTDAERRIEYPTLARTAIRLRLERESLSEEMRLLYVAMTRPKERLFITAALRKPEERAEQLSHAVTRPMEPEALSAASCLADWLICAAAADGGAHLKLRFCPPAENDTAPIPPEAEVLPDEESLLELERRLSFRYAHAEAEALPSKVTATELKDRLEPDEDAAALMPTRPRRFALPDFSKASKPLTGAAGGTATHLALQYMDFSCTGSVEQIREEIGRLREQRFLSPREAEAVDCEALARLFASPLGARMLSAEKLHREFKFSLLCDAEELFGKAAGEELLLQGVVDCCLEEGDGLVLIDYKTDRVRTEDEIRQRTAFYTPQLAAYAGALARIFGKPVKESILYFLRPGRTVPVRQKKG